MDPLVTPLVGILGIFVGIRGNRHFDDRRGDRERWQRLRERLMERDLENLEHDTYQARRIPVSLIRQLRNFAEDIEEDREEVRFSRRTEDRLKRSKGRFVAAYRAYRDFVCVPFWEHLHSDDWEFRKMWFVDRGDDYGEHLRLACEQIDEMSRAYRKMYDAVRRW